MTNFAILVVWADGTEEYLKEGVETARFTSRERAEKQRDFMKIGMDGDEDVESISVVKYPESVSVRRFSA
jgi:hypothetical protein